MKKELLFTSRINQDCRSVASVLSRLNYSFFGSLKSFGVVIYIFVMSPFVGAYILLGSFLLCVIRYFSMKKREKQRKSEDDEQERYMSTFSEVIRGIRDIKVLNLKDKMIHKTLKDQEKLNTMYRKNRKRMLVINEAEYFLRRFIDFGIYPLVLYLISKGLFLITNFLILYTYKSQAFSFLQTLFYRRRSKYSLFFLTSL